MKVNRVALLGLLVITTMCTLGVDVSQLFSTSVYTCLKNNGYHFVIPRGYCSYGGVDAHVVQNLNNAKAAGLATDIYMFPCRGKSATAQVDQMMSAISSKLFEMVWIDVETNPSSGCGWGSNHSANCEYLTQIINRIKSHNKNVGVYTSQYMWTNIMGSKTACQGVASHHLWYAHYDKKADFSDYSQIGGWKKPNIKQFQGDTTLCGAGIDKNYHP